MPTIYVNFVTRLQTGGYYERTLAIDIDCDDDEIYSTNLKLAITQKLGIELNKITVIDVYRLYSDPAPDARAHLETDGKFDMQELQKKDNPLHKFSVRIPLQTFYDLDALLAGTAEQTSEQPSEERKPDKIIYIPFSDVSEGKMMDTKIYAIAIDGNIEEISAGDLRELLAKKLKVNIEKLVVQNVIEAYTGTDLRIRYRLRGAEEKTSIVPILDKFLASDKKKYSIEELKVKKPAGQERFLVQVQDEKLYNQLGNLLEEAKREEGIEPEKEPVLEVRDRRNWAEQLGLDVFAHAEQAAKAMVGNPFASAPARLALGLPPKAIPERSKKLFSTELQALNSQISLCKLQAPLFPKPIVDAAEKIYQAVNTQINNNVAFSSLSEDEVTDCFRLVDIINNVLVDFPKAAKSKVVPVADGVSASSAISLDDPYDMQLDELNNIAKRIQGSRSPWKIIGGLILAFVAVVGMALIAFANLASAGTLTVPNLLPAYLTLGLFSGGIKLAVAGGLSLGTIGIGAAVAYNNRLKGVAETMTPFSSIVRTERKGHREVHAESEMHFSKIK